MSGSVHHVHISPSPNRENEECVCQQIDAPSILIVEDEPMMRRSLCELLRPQGYQVHEAARGREAKKALSSNSYHVALIDLNLPDYSGQNLIEFAYQNGLNTKIIVVSGEASFENASHALKYGVYDFVKKPFDVSSLLKTISNATKEIEEKQEQEASPESNGVILSDEIYKFIVDNSPDVIYVLDKDGYFAFVNQQSTELIGCQPDKLIGKHYTKIVYSQDINKSYFAFNEWRMGTRSTKRIEMRLNKLDHEGSRKDISSYVSIELISKGIYKKNKKGKREFVGTYGVIRDMTERRRSEEIIRYHLYHDGLTSLPNRALFNDRVHMAILHAKRNQKKLALMFLDLDHFKKINDNFGHQAGDEILQSVAKALKGCIRETDTLARIGGDEFLLLTQDLASAEDASRICQKILETLNEPIAYRGKSIRITGSIGIALYPDNGNTKDELIRHADMAMYRIKEVGCNKYCFYKDTFQTNDLPNLELENDLYSAIQRNELMLYYQPQVESVHENVVGIEALMRWKHHKYGLISPSIFIPIAEQNGLIYEIGNWGLQQACRDAINLKKHGFFHLKTSFNISVQQLYNPNFVKDTLGIIHKYNIDQSSIELEITESSLMHDLQSASNMLRELSQDGVSIAIDDFGAGYSSLSYLQNLSINTLKLDRSFIQRANLKSSEKTIFTAIQSMAQSMGIHFIAEGVETLEQKLYLESMGFQSIIQGFYYSHPLPIDELMHFIEQQNQHAG